MANAHTPAGDIPPYVNDWTSVKIDKKQDIKDSFVERFYFSCEADDSLNYTAFNAKANKMGARLKAMFSSDLGHWDVKDWGGKLVCARHAKRGCIEETLSLDQLFERCAPYFAGEGRMIDQAWQSRLPESMIRCYLAHDKVAGFGYQAINALVPAPPAVARAARGG